MKNIRIILIVVLLGVSFASCDKILDKPPLDIFAQENFFTSEANVRGYGWGFYNDFTGYGTSGSGDFYFPTLNDNQVGTSFTRFTQSVPGTDTYWNGRWTMIRRSNIMIEQVQNMSNITDEAKAHWIAFGKLFRAWSHYRLVRRYGDVPWVEKSLDITDEAILFGPRTNRDIVMDNVLKDLESINDLYNNTLQNQVNRAVGYAIKSEICLYEGTHRKYRPTPDAAGATRFLQECVSASEALMTDAPFNAGGGTGRTYALAASYRSLYNSVSLANNSEMIL